MSYNGIELYLSQHILWSLEQRLQQKIVVNSKNEIVIKFMQIFNNDEFYQSLIETLHISTGIDLIKQSVGVFN